jgi:hypothetical protein
MALPAGARRASLAVVPRHGSLRASDADREQIVDRLRKACAEGRLAVHELEQRVSAALRARTYADLDATVADLPGQRVGPPRSAAATRAVRTVRAHPALLIVAIPVALVVAATLIAIAVLWTVIMVLLFVISQRRYGYWRPTRYAARRGFGPPPRAYCGRGPAGGAYWRI